MKCSICRIYPVSPEFLESEKTTVGGVMLALVKLESKMHFMGSSLAKREKMGLGLLANESLSLCELLSGC